MKVSYKTLKKMEGQLKDFFQEKADFDVKLRTNDSIEQDLASELLLEGMTNGIMFMLHFAGVKYNIDEHQLGFEIDVEQTIAKQLERKDNKVQSFIYYLNRIKKEIFDELDKIEKDYKGVDSLMLLGTNLYNIYGFYIVANILGCKLNLKNIEDMDENLEDLLKGNLQVFDDRDAKNLTNYDWLSYDDYKAFGKDLDDIVRSIFEISQIEDVNNSYYWQMDFFHTRKQIWDSAEAVIKNDKKEQESNSMEELVNLYTTRTLDNTMISMDMFNESVQSLIDFIHKYF